MQQTKPPRGGRRRAEAVTMAAFALAKPPREGYPARRREVFRKLLVGALFAFVLSLSTLGVGSKSASAEVIENAWFDVTGRVVANPCNGLDITLSGSIHTVWYTTPEGHTMMRYNIHYTGTDFAGTKYVFNATKLMEHWDWENMAPLTDVVRSNVISKGSGQNFVMTLTLNYTETWPAPYDIAFTCKG